MGKKSGEENFDVPVGCIDGAEVCELVGSYIFNKLTNVTNTEKIDLYIVTMDWEYFKIYPKLK